MKRRSPLTLREPSPKPRRYINSDLTIYLAAVSTAILTYVNSLSGDFVHDDIPAIVSNGDVLGTNDFSEMFFNDFWGTPMADVNSHKSYRPLTTLTFRINHSLHGLSAWWFHACNTALHACCCALVARTCLTVARIQRPFAALASVLFAIHPIHTEAVTGIVGRADVLACIFFLSSLLVYHGTSSGNHCVWLSNFLGGLSMLAKETGITVLILNISFDLYRCWPSIRKSIAEIRWNKTSRGLSLRATKVVICLIFLVTARVAVLQGSLPTFSIQDNPAAFHPNFFVRFMTFCYLAAFNWWLVLCPSSLSHDWQMGSIQLISSASDPRNIFTCAAFGTLFLVAFVCLKDFECHRHTPLVFGLLLLILPFVPASNLLVTVGFVVAERVLYIPSVGSVILTIYGIQLMWRHRPAYRTTLTFFLIILVVSAVAKTYQRNKDWRTRETLLRADLSVLPHNAKLHYNYGNYLRDIENQEGAVTHYKEALKLWPTYASAHNNLGTVTVSTSNAEHHFLQAIKYSRDHVNAHFNLGKLYRKNNRISEALKMLERCISLEPRFVQAYLELVQLKPELEKGGLFKKLISLEPINWEHHLLYGKWLKTQGLRAAATKHFEEALRIRIQKKSSDKAVNRIDAEVFRNLALELRSLGQKSRIFQLMTRWQASVRPKARIVANNVYIREWRLKIELAGRAKAYSLITNVPPTKTCYDHRRLEVNVDRQSEKESRREDVKTEIRTRNPTIIICGRKMKDDTIAVSTNYKLTHNKSEPGHKHKICGSNRNQRSNVVKKGKENLTPFISETLMKTF